MKKLILAALFVLLASALSFATNTTATLNVTATLLPTVSVQTTNLDFGDWLIGDSQHSATATITVTATNGTDYKIGLDAGTHFSGGFRNVQNGTDMVPYFIYSDTSNTEWGDNGLVGGTYSAGNPVSEKGSGSAQLYTAYGVLRTDLASATSSIGSYTDLVTVTVNY
ncbi:MAG TPA: spore coat protein U domain-containing protein [Spirochaetia bacterium]|nr:spore coat protein U domain-containing protein [Spirochaetia bacterium]